MKEKKNNNVIFSSVGVVMLLIITIGISYAAFTATGITDLNSISSGTVSMSFAENSNVINLSRALPVDSDIAEKSSNTYFQFVVTSTTNSVMDVNYIIKATEIAVDDDYTSLGQDEVIIYLTKYENSTETALSYSTVYNKLNDTNSGNLYSAKHEHSVAGTISTVYRLRMWIPSSVDASSWTSETKLEYKLRIDVDGNA